MAGGSGYHFFMAFGMELESWSFASLAFLWTTCLSCPCSFKGHQSVQAAESGRKVCSRNCLVSWMHLPKSGTSNEIKPSKFWIMLANGCFIPQSNVLAEVMLNPHICWETALFVQQTWHMSNLYIQDNLPRSKPVPTRHHVTLRCKSLPGNSHFVYGPSLSFMSIYIYLHVLVIATLVRLYHVISNQWSLQTLHPVIIVIASFGLKCGQSSCNHLLCDLHMYQCMRRSFRQLGRRYFIIAPPNGWAWPGFPF